MATVETVRGPVDSADLGRTYVHEHVFVLTPDVQQNYPGTSGVTKRRARRTRCPSCPRWPTPACAPSWIRR